MKRLVKDALLKGKRGIVIDQERCSVSEFIRNECGLQGFSMNEVALLSGIQQARFYGILNGEIGVTEKELQKIEEVLCIKIDRTKLTPMKWLMSERSSQPATAKKGV